MRPFERNAQPRGLIADAEFVANVCAPADNGIVETVVAPIKLAMRERNQADGVAGPGREEPADLRAKRAALSGRTSGEYCALVRLLLWNTALSAANVVSAARAIGAVVTTAANATAIRDKGVG